MIFTSSRKPAGWNDMSAEDVHWTDVLKLILKAQASDDSQEKSTRLTVAPHRRLLV